MKLDFSKIDYELVGYQLSAQSAGDSLAAGKRYAIAPVKFNELVGPISEGKSSRWEVYQAFNRLADEIDVASKALSNASSRSSGIDLEDIAGLTLMGNCLNNAMALMVREYLSKGNIDNKPHFSDL